ncbi:hypothetical protein BV898_18671 [Hypsibius exemplaris]|uniref:Uncharacterized protein n=1 Tax=Hypsibius exemplaris TaxID=2072580 RepID=A0A9X6RP24_HYPEX|nr:hypothetical protein BV898_18671 [Hypsibius exemplaris]
MSTGLLLERKPAHRPRRREGSPNAAASHSHYQHYYLRSAFIDVTTTLDAVVVRGSGVLPSSTRTHDTTARIEGSPSPGSSSLAPL